MSRTNVENKEQKHKVIKNASLEEIEKLKKQMAVEATQAPNTTSIHTTTTTSQNIHTTTTTETHNTVKLKPAQSIFEPKPVPIKLPSRNLVVTHDLTENHEIYIKRMSSVEEGLLYNIVGISDTTQINQTLDRIIDNCIKSQISVYELSLIDKLTVLMNIFYLTYGEFNVDIECKECRKKHAYTINLRDDLLTTYVPDDIEYPHKIHLTTYDEYGFNLDWYITYFTIEQANDILTQNTIDLMLLITHSITGTYINDKGEKAQPTPDLYKDILYNLNDIDRNAYREFLNKFGEYGTQFILPKHYCRTIGCIANINKKPLELPYEQIFMHIFNISKEMLTSFEQQ